MEKTVRWRLSFCLFVSFRGVMCNNSARDPKNTNYVGHEKKDRLIFASLFACYDYYICL